MKASSSILIASLASIVAACGSSGTEQAEQPHAATASFTIASASQDLSVSIAGYRSDYIISSNASRITVTNKSNPNEVQEFNNISLIKFVDKYTSLDIDGPKGRVYRLYQAAFDRKPDPAGLGFWIYTMETSDLAMEAIAGHFLDSKESISLYGLNPSNDNLIKVVYRNVLHRAPEQIGFDWWLNVMNNGTSRQSMLYSFSESQENKANLLPDMANGFDYVPHVEIMPGTAVPDISTIFSNIRFSNIDYLPNVNGRPAGTWHWSGTPSRHVLVHIPAPRNGTEQDYADKVNNSIAQINTKLKGLLFLEATNVSPMNINYIQVSYDTAYVPPGSANYAGFCANVSTAPYSGEAITPDRQNNVASNPVYVNLGNGHCNVTQDIVTHEFGHALGLGNHFSGFGSDGSPPISTIFWDVLATLYANPRSTAVNDLVVRYVD